jgi:hypothetical protein
MEHFTREQLDITREFHRIALEFHTFNPYNGSVFYRLGKWVAEKNGSWPYGRELPVRTMKDIFEGSGFVLQAEYSIAHLASLDFISFLSNNTGQIFRLFFADLIHQTGRICSKG